MSTSKAASEARISTTARAVWFEAKHRAAVREEEVLAPNDDELTIRARLSLISQGTEMQVYRGQISAETDLGLETCRGTFAFPVKYAYQVVGDVEAAGKNVPFVPGQTVFVNHPHQERFTMRYNPDLLFSVPAGFEPEQAVFANLACVAYNALLDVPVRIGDVVVVFGHGIVGTFCSLFARKTAGRLIVVDPLPDRRRRALDNGADAAVAPEGLAEILEKLADGRGADVVIEASSAPRALQQAIAATGQEGTVVVVSYYGTREVKLVLAPEFHFKRHRIVSSQVSSLGSGLQPRWDFTRRMGVVFDLLAELPVRDMITHRFDIAEAPKAYEFVDTRADETLGVVFTYPE